jgi:hypothetical protein
VPSAHRHHRGLLAVGGLGTFLVVASRRRRADRRRQAVEIEKGIFVMPADQQIAEWRRWAASDRSNELKMEALKQLAWAKDPEGVDLCIAALKHVVEPIRAQAATALAEYGLPLAEKAKPALLAALKEAGPADKPQIAWALVELGEASAISTRSWHFTGSATSRRCSAWTGCSRSTPTRSSTSSPSTSSRGTPRTRARPSGSSSPPYCPASRSPSTPTCSSACSRTKTRRSRGRRRPGWDRSATSGRASRCSRCSAGGQGEPQALPVGAARWCRTKGLVLALDTVDTTDPDRAWFQTKQILDLIEGARDAGTFGLNDPRGGDALVSYLEKKPHIHWQTRTAFALANIGDIRAVPTLAKRLRMDPLKIYSDDTDYEMLLKRDDNERVVAARMIADLAYLHPDKLAQIRSRPRTPSSSGSTSCRRRTPTGCAPWRRCSPPRTSSAAPQVGQSGRAPALPKEGQQPPMPEEWVIAQSAMRYAASSRTRRPGRPGEGPEEAPARDRRHHG